MKDFAVSLLATSLIVSGMMAYIAYGDIILNKLCDALIGKSGDDAELMSSGPVFDRLRRAL